MHSFKNMSLLLLALGFAVASPILENDTTNIGRRSTVGVGLSANGQDNCDPTVLSNIWCNLHTGGLSAIGGSSEDCDPTLLRELCLAQLPERIYGHASDSGFKSDAIRNKYASGDQHMPKTKAFNSAKMGDEELGNEILNHVSDLLESTPGDKMGHIDNDQHVGV